MTLKMRQRILLKRPYSSNTNNDQNEDTEKG